MRTPAKTVRRTAALAQAGARARRVLEGFILEQPEALRVLQLLGDPDAELDERLESLVAEARARLAHEFRAQDVEPVNVAGHRGRLRPGLIGAFIRASGDADTDVETWLREGAPHGILRPIEARGVFPKSSNPGRDLEELHAATFRPYDQVANYSSVEDNRGITREELRRDVDNGFAGFYSAAEAEHKYGPLVVSELALQLKRRADGSIKRRLLNDLKRSRLNEFSSYEERVVLPRREDLFNDLVELAEVCDFDAGEDVEILVLDFVDAYKIVPTHPDERSGLAALVPASDDEGEQPIAATEVRRSLDEIELMVYYCLVMGGKACALIWCRLAAWIGRSTQSLFNEAEARLELYMDDPALAARGTPRQRADLFTVAILYWLALGIPLSWKKGGRGRYMDWIGASYRVDRTAVCLTCPAEKARDIARQCAAQLRQTNVPMRSVRTLAGTVLVRRRHRAGHSELLGSAVGGHRKS